MIRVFNIQKKYNLIKRGIFIISTVAVISLPSCTNINLSDIEVNSKNSILEDYNNFKNDLNIPDIYFKYKPIIEEFNKLNNLSYYYDEVNNVYYTNDYSVCYILYDNNLQFTVKKDNYYEAIIYNIRSIDDLEEEIDLYASTCTTVRAYDENNKSIGLKENTIAFDYPNEGKVINCITEENLDGTNNIQCIRILNMKTKDVILIYNQKSAILFSTYFNGDNKYFNIEEPKQNLLDEFHEMFENPNLNCIEAFCWTYLDNPYKELVITNN